MRRSPWTVGPLSAVMASVVVWLLFGGLVGLVDGRYNAKIGGGEATMPVLPTSPFRMLGRHHEFSIRLLRDAVSESPKENILFSPYTIYRGFLILFFMTFESTKDYSLRLFLGLPIEQDKHTMFGLHQMEKGLHMLKRTSPSANVHIGMTEHVFLSQEWNLLKVAEDHLFDVIDRIRIRSYTDTATEYINKWMANNTYGYIQDFVTEDVFDDDMNVVIASGLYYEGKWKNEFLVEHTTEQPFQVSETNNETVPMMWQTGDYQVLDSYVLGAMAIELPYKKGNYSLILVKSWKDQWKFNIGHLLQKLNAQSMKNFASTNNWKPETVEVTLPKFKITQRTDNLRKMSLQMGAPKYGFDLALHKAGIVVEECGLTGNVTARNRTTGNGANGNETTTGNGPNGNGTAIGNGPNVNGTTTGNGANGNGTTIGNGANGNGTATDNGANGNGTTTGNVANGNGTITGNVANGNGTTTDNVANGNGTTAGNGPDGKGTTADNGPDGNGTATVRQMRFDSPFIYVLYDRAYATVLLTGVYNYPPPNN